MPAHQHQSYTQNKNKTNNKLNIRTGPIPRKIMLQRFSDYLKHKTVQLQWSTHRMTNLLNQRWQFEVPLDIKVWIYFPFHAIAMEKRTAQKQRRQFSSIGCLIIEIDQIVSRVKCVTVVLQGVFIWMLISLYWFWTACNFGRCRNCGPEKHKVVSPNSSGLGNA